MTLSKPFSTLLPVSDDRRSAGKLRPYSRIELGPVRRFVLAGGGAILTVVSGIAILRGLLGMAPVSLAELSPIVQIHIATVVPCIPLGAWLFFAPKGTGAHRYLGRVWCALMMATAISTLFIRGVNDGGFSFLHIFSLLTLVGVPLGIIHVLRGTLVRHVRTLSGLYIGALLIAGGFSFLPGRVMWLLAFG